MVYGWFMGGLWVVYGWFLALGIPQVVEIDGGWEDERLRHALPTILHARRERGDSWESPKNHHEVAI